MSPVQMTDTVSASYTATLSTGEVIESVPEEKPILVPLGSGRILKAVEATMMGMEPGDVRQVTIEPEDAFGLHQKDLVQELDRSLFESKFTPQPGMTLALSVEQNGVEQKVPATVIEVTEEKIIVDYNHPLAGQKVTYTFKVHSIGT